jgi:serine kinase of HPr protein (carbohydrate metabolism regulator)
MKVGDIIKTLNANLLTTDMDFSGEVTHAFTSDLMSDVLTLENEGTLLISGLSNLQVIRTAEMSDIKLVIIGRNKMVSGEMIELARKSSIVLMQSPYSLFRISGMLYAAGLKPVF